MSGAHLDGERQLAVRRVPIERHVRRAPHAGRARDYVRIAVWKDDDVADADPDRRLAEDPAPATASRHHVIGNEMIGARENRFRRSTRPAASRPPTAPRRGCRKTPHPSGAPRAAHRIAHPSQPPRTIEHERLTLEQDTARSGRWAMPSGRAVIRLSATPRYTQNRQQNAQFYIAPSQGGSHAAVSGHSQSHRGG